MTPEKCLNRIVPGRRSGCNGGFTLVEVMVALVIFAVVSVAVVRNTALSLRQAGAIQEKTLSWWLAENQMAKLRMQERDDSSFPSAGISREIVEISGNVWEVETNIKSTENELVRRVEVLVYRGSEDEPSTELVGFLGRH